MLHRGRQPEVEDWRRSDFSVPGSSHDHVQSMNISDLASRRIVVVISSLGAGGAERVIASLSSHWLAAGAQVTVIAFDHPSQPIYHHFDEAVRFCRLSIPHKGGASVLRRVAALRAALHAEAPDVAVSFLTKINVLTLAATVGTSIPVIAAERNNPERQGAHILWRFTITGLYHRAAAIVCQTTASLRCIPPRVRQRVVVIPNPVAASPFEPERTSPPRLVAVGRLTEQKGFDLAIEAFARVATRHPNWRLDMWGEGPWYSALQDRINELGLQNRVMLRGLSRSPGSWIADASAFILPSRYEGFPNVLAEAMAAGLPVAATNCDFGPAELITPEETGLLVAPDDVDALAQGIDRLLSDAALRTKLGRAASLSVKRFEPARVFALWDHLLLDVLRTKSQIAVTSNPACLPSAPPA